MSGVPVRLIEKGEGRIISLDCIEHHITTRREVPMMRVPILGQRAGIDPNMVNVEIKLVCILRDDDCSAADLVSKKANGFIDFSSTSTATDYMVGGAGQAVSVWGDLNGARFEFRATDGTQYTATFDTSATNHDGTSDPLNIVVGIKALTDAGGNPKGSDVATRLKGALEHNTSASNRFTNKFTIVTQDGLRGPVITLVGEKETKLLFTQVTAGLTGNNETPIFVAPTAANKLGSNDLGKLDLLPPFMGIFSGGSENNCRSAGDKAQDLLANVVNSNYMGVSGNVRIEKSLTGLGDAESIFDAAEGIAHKDYVLGLQIPYNSLTQASLGSVGDPIQGYEPRNFMFITGYAKSEQQGSAANDEPASVIFDPSNKYTGIHGCITECALTYLAGDTTYQAEIVFQPLDMLLGI